MAAAKADAGCCCCCCCCVVVVVVVLLLLCCCCCCVVVFVLEVVVVVDIVACSNKALVKHKIVLMLKLTIFQLVFLFSWAGMREL